MKLTLLFLLYSFGLSAQTNEIILGKRFGNFKFDETTYRQTKRHFKGKNKTIEKGISCIRTVNKCLSLKHLTLNYYELGLSFDFRQSIKSKKYYLRSITMDSLSVDYINFSLNVNTSTTKDFIEIFGQPKTTATNEMIFGSNSLIIKFDKDSVVRQVVINANRIHYITEADF